jgi:hypothetical protein
VLIVGLGLILTASAQAQVQWFKPIASNNTSATINNGASIGMTIDTNGAISSMYSLQLSQNLTMTNSPWQLLPTIGSRITLTNSPQFYLDTSVPSRTNRFYRAAPPAL